MQFGTDPRLVRQVVEAVKRKQAAGNTQIVPQCKRHRQYC